MIKQAEVVIKNLLERQGLLQQQLDAQVRIIDTQNHQIRVLEEKIDILETCNKKLSEAIEQLVIENEKVDDIYIQQQMLLEEFLKRLE